MWKALTKLTSKNSHLLCCCHVPCCLHILFPILRTACKMDNMRSILEMRKLRLKEIKFFPQRIHCGKSGLTQPSSTSPSPFTSYTMPLTTFSLFLASFPSMCSLSTMRKRKVPDRSRSGRLYIWSLKRLHLWLQQSCVIQSGNNIPSLLSSRPYSSQFYSKVHRRMATDRTSEYG